MFLGVLRGFGSKHPEKKGAQENLHTRPTAMLHFGMFGAEAGLARMTPGGGIPSPLE
jgi:hypothetical protein